MPDDIFDDNTPSPSQSPMLSLQPQLKIGNPQAADRYLAEHEQRRAKYESNFDAVMKQRQDAINSTRAVLDKTISEMRDAHRGSVNLPLLAFGAGMLSAPQPGMNSNFGTELGAGMRAAGAALQNQRMRDDEFYRGIAALQQKQGMMSDIPLKDAAALARSQQIAEQNMTGQIERAKIASKVDQARSLGAGILQLPDGRIVNAFSNEEIDPNKMTTGAGGQNLIGGDTHGVDYLNSIPSPETRTLVKGLGDYNAQMPQLARSPQALAYTKNLFAMVKQYNPDFDEKNYKSIQKAMNDWTGGGTMGKQALAASNVGVHLPNLQEAAADLDPSSFAVINKMRNIISDNTDDPRVKRFQAALLPVVTEMTKFLGGGHPAEGTMNEWMKTVGAANGPRQLQSAFTEFAKIMHGQLGNMATKKNDDLKLSGDRAVTPETLIGKSADGYSPSDRLADMLRNDISTPGGLYAVKRRSMNNELAMKKQAPMPSFTAEQFDAAAKELKNPTAPEMKALSLTQRDQLFDEMFGQGAAAAARGSKKR